MWRCEKCGKENSGEAKYCTNCGQAKSNAQREREESGKTAAKGVGGFLGSPYFSIGITALLFTIVGILIGFKLLQAKPPEPTPEVSAATAIVLMEETPPAPTPMPTPTPVPIPTPPAPFYGIWCAASKDQGIAEKNRLRFAEAGLDAQLFVTTDWSNLNPEKYYVVTAGTYNSYSEAEAMLPTVKSVVSNAYIKYSGDWQRTIGE